MVDIPKSTYYFELHRIDIDSSKNAEIIASIKQIYLEHKTRYGVRRVHKELLRRGFLVNHKKVQRLMNKLGLKGKRPKEKYHSFIGEVGKIADNLIHRDFTTTKPLEKWTTDVTQFSLSWGKCYLSVILDMYNNEIISYVLSQSPNIKQVRIMLEKAFEKEKNTNGLIFHSDQGWQYQHAEYRKILKEHGIIQSMSRKGNCYDNSIMETFFARLKNEMFYGHENEYKNYLDFSNAIDEYIEYYNCKRIQAKTNWMPPVLYRMASNLES